MGRVAVIGEQSRVVGFGLVGALVLVAERPGEVRARWRDLPGDVTLVVLTSAAARALAGTAGMSAGPAGAGPPGGPGRLTAVMPP